MTSRERVLTALDLRPPDLTPRCLYGEALGDGYVPAIRRLFAEKCGGSSPLDYFGMDLSGVTLDPTRLDRERFADYLPEAARDAALRFVPTVKASRFEEYLLNLPRAAPGNAVRESADTPARGSSALDGLSPERRALLLKRVRERSARPASDE